MTINIVFSKKKDTKLIKKGGEYLNIHVEKVEWNDAFSLYWDGYTTHPTSTFVQRTVISFLNGHVIVARTPKGVRLYTEGLTENESINFGTFEELIEQIDDYLEYFRASI